MMDTAPDYFETAVSSQRRRWMAVAFAVGGLWVLASCGAFVLRQGWDPNMGPVIPHDTFPADCSICHMSGSWDNLRDDFQYDHEAETGVPLHGAHANAPCLLCHNDRGPVANFADRGCAGCHVDIHRDDLGHACEACHNEMTWRPIEMIADHNRTRFPLVGAHAATACRACHPGGPVGNFAGADPTCTSCHTSAVAQSIDHLAFGWVDRCDRCHRPLAWKPAAFIEHPSSFPLIGSHAGVNCDSCHHPGTFSGLSTACEACHSSAGVERIDHVSQGWVDNCDRCHSIFAWRPAVFGPHPASFPLTHGHGNLECTACHSPNTFQGLSTRCAACHLDDYQGTSEPDHQSAGFSTQCELCHDTTSWGDGDFDHDFPLSGPHNEACNECHQVPGDMTIFSCTHCHAHRQSKMDDEHDDVGGYVWESTACYSCHPDGND